MRDALDALHHHERTVLDSPAGVVLRYGTIYGPGTAYAEGGLYVREIRRRRFPIVGDGGGVSSFVHVDTFVHVDNVARATLAAIERGAPGVFNIVDDEAARVSVWLSKLAAAVGAKPLRHVPRWVARLVAGELAVLVLTEIRGASNAKARRELGWSPAYSSWRDGFRQGLADA